MNLIPRRAIGIGIFYTLISIAFPALAATNPPIKCRVLGETTIYKGKLYTCIRSRSKGKTILTWDSGKVIPVATTTSSQIPNPSVSPTPTASPPVIVKKLIFRLRRLLIFRITQQSLSWQRIVMEIAQPIFL